MSKKMGRPPAVWRHTNLQVSASIWLDIGHTWSHSIKVRSSSPVSTGTTYSYHPSKAWQDLANCLAECIHPSSYISCQATWSLESTPFQCPLISTNDSFVQVLKCGVGKEKVMHWLEKVHPNHPNPWSNMWTANEWKIWFACFKRE